LTGTKIAITGSTKTKRSDLEKFISDNGGENKSSVGKSCTHLVIADVNSTSSKAVAARKLGIKLIDEESLLNLAI
jgi:DNA ligase (NAD+)